MIISLGQNFFLAFQSVNGNCNYYYGYTAKVAGCKLWILNNKKHPAYDSVQMVWKRFSDITKEMTANAIGATETKELKTIIAFFNRLKKEYNSDEKADRKLRYSCFYNNAVIYTHLLDNPAAALKEAEGLRDNGYDGSDAKELIKNAEDLQEVFAKHKTKTIHFSRLTPATLTP